jgi:methylenetetrahydrofolate dehydrogenase (NADP+)/methenyltetrahydrofolate cyclohydrolase
MIINGTEIAKKIRADLKTRVHSHIQSGKRAPCLAVVLVGQDPASQVYVGHKEKACLEAGMESKTFRLPEMSSESEIVDLVRQLNADPGVDGILVQLPLPKHISSDKVIDMIDPRKDVDGLTAMNQGYLSLGRKALRPCTPAGCMELIKTQMPSLKGKIAVVVGRSILVGSPIAKMLLLEDATVIQVHSKTPDPEIFTRMADVLVVAAGKKHLVNGSWLKKGALVIDVGIHRGEDGKLTGDVDFDSVNTVASAVTPVPGGVGPMTIAMLLKNCLEAYESKI